MDLMFEDANAYYLYKVFLHLLVKENLKQYMDKNSQLYGADYLYYFKIYITLFSNAKVLSDDFKNNIQMYLNEVRFCNLKKIKENDKKFFMNNMNKLLLDQVMIVFKYMDDKNKKKFINKLINHLDILNIEKKSKINNLIEYTFKNDRYFLINVLNEIVKKDNNYENIKSFWEFVKKIYMKKPSDVGNDDVRLWKTNWINYLIMSVNKGSKDNYINFCRFELSKRMNKTEYLDKRQVPEQIIKKEIPSLLNSMCFDQFVLYSHSIEVNDEYFNLEYLPVLIRSEKYLESIYCIFEECPSKFYDPIFKKRCECVLKNKINFIEDKSSIKKTKKIISRVGEYKYDLRSLKM